MNNKRSNRPSEPNSSEALQQTQRLLAWSAYQESLKNVDREVLNQLQITTSHLRASLWVKAITYAFQFLVLSLALLYGLLENLRAAEDKPWAWIISFVSLVLIAILLFRNPVRSINHTLVDLVRVQVILQGYTRQINQVDAIFKQALLESKMDMKNISKSLDYLQKVIDGNVESLLQIIDDLN